MEARQWSWVIYTVTGPGTGHVLQGILPVSPMSSLISRDLSFSFWTMSVLNLFQILRGHNGKESPVLSVVLG